jgi:flavin reductase (DIM6/NTAB) family NADH-FMN oxidoreductase RutF
MNAVTPLSQATRLSSQADRLSQRPRLAQPAQLPKAVRTPQDDAADFRTAFRHLAGGVSVITIGQGEDRSGLTATSVASLSADPPSVMFAVNQSSSSFPLLQRHRSFGVNFLNATQKQVADRFAGRQGEKGLERYAGAEWTSAVTGASLLVGALAALDCEVEEMIERHSHSIIIGRVRAVRLGTDDAALLYWRGDYERLGWMIEEATGALGLRAC